MTEPDPTPGTVLAELLVGEPPAAHPPSSSSEVRWKGTGTQGGG
jgi:hypothetical protein